MAHDKITIALDGDIPLQSLAEALTHLNSLVDGLTTELAGQPIDWIIDELSYGSAVASVRGYAEDEAAVERTVGASENVFRAIESGEPIDYSQRISRPAYELSRLVGGRVIAIHFYTSDTFHATITAPRAPSEPTLLYRQAYGRVEGVVENLFRRSARFMLTDHVTKRPVSCHLEQGQDEVMRTVWGRPAAVTGWVTRDARSGRPVVVENITSVQPLVVSEPGTFRRARGAVVPKAGALSPEAIMRTIRDGS